jgi:hypothetical protein
MALWIVAYPHGARRSSLVTNIDGMLDEDGGWVKTPKRRRIEHFLQQDLSLNFGPLHRHTHTGLWGRTDWTVVGLCKVRSGKLWEGLLTDFDNEERVMHTYWRRPLDAYTVSLSEVWAMREPTSISTCRKKPRRWSDDDPEAQERYLVFRSPLFYPTTDSKASLEQATLECVRGPRKGETHRADAVLTWLAGGEYP